MKRKNVQLSFELFAALIKFHLLQEASYENEIKEGLEKKLDALVNHELYARYKTSPTAEEKEKARLEYLDKRGIQEEFRW